MRGITESGALKIRRDLLLSFPCVGTTSSGSIYLTLPSPTALSQLHHFCPGCSSRSYLRPLLAYGKCLIQGRSAARLRRPGVAVTLGLHILYISSSPSPAKPPAPFELDQPAMVEAHTRAPRRQDQHPEQ